MPATERAARLKERVYVTFTALTVVLAMSSHATDLDPPAAITTLLIAVTGTLLAVFVADYIAHLAVHQQIPNGTELRHMIGESVGAFGVLPLPLLALSVSALGGWSLAAGLAASAAVLIGSVVFIGYLAVRRTGLPLW